MHEPYSRVTVETRDADGTVSGRTSGTTGRQDLGADIAYALDSEPRSILVLASAVCVMYDRVKDKNEPPPLLKAAMKYVEQWEAFDRFTAAHPQATTEEIIDRCPK